MQPEIGREPWVRLRAEYALTRRCVDPPHELSTHRPTFASAWVGQTPQPVLPSHLLASLSAGSERVAEQPLPHQLSAQAQSASLRRWLGPLQRQQSPNWYRLPLQERAVDGRMQCLEVYLSPPLQY